MHILQCSNGHYYDGDKYTICPHCKVNVVPETPKTPEKTEESNSVFDRMERAGKQPVGKTEGLYNSVEEVKTDYEQSQEEEQKSPCLTEAANVVENVSEKTSETPSPVMQNDFIQPGLSESKQEAINPSETDDYYTSKTDPFEFVVPEGSSEENTEKEIIPGTESFRTEEVQIRINDSESISVTEEPVQREKVQSVPLNDKEEPVRNPAPVVTVKQEINEEIKQAASADDGKTLGFFRSNAQTLNEPVVGWLVCIKGKHFGECFELKSGRNSVGRNDDNKVVISEDFSVSGSKHLWVIYEPKKREFYVQPGESSGLSYLNGDNILAPQKMQAYDQLEFGTGLYVLIPLCNESFSWEDYLN